MGCKGMIQEVCYIDTLGSKTQLHHGLQVMIQVEDRERKVFEIN